MMRYRKIILTIILIIAILLAGVACTTENNTLEPDVETSIPTLIVTTTENEIIYQEEEVTIEDETNSLDVNTTNVAEEEIIAFILNAERVFRDIGFGNLFSARWDDIGEELIFAEHTEKAPDLLVEHPNGRYHAVRYHILPSSGFSTVADLNTALHKYWGDNFSINEEGTASESLGYSVIDNNLYFFPPMASGVGDHVLNTLWDKAQFELLHQDGDNATIRAELHITSYGDLFLTGIQWEIIDGRIVSRDMDFGDHVLWRDNLDLIDEMINVGLWSEKHVVERWEMGWFDEEEIKVW